MPRPAAVVGEPLSEDDSPSPSGSAGGEDHHPGAAVPPGVAVPPPRQPGAPRARHRAPRKSGKARKLRVAAFACVGIGVVGTAALRGLPHTHVQATAEPPRRPAPQTARDIAPAGRAALLPGVGPKFGARIPADARQALVVTGASADSSTSTVVLWQRDASGRWQPGATWAAHNALRGWGTDHHEGDLRSPVGVFTLTAAGGLNANPGTKLPYDHSTAFQAGGTGFEGEPLTGAFDYVVAIDYNRVPGSTPLDPRAPLGPSRGQGLWVHVDHGGPTHGCVSLSSAHMVDLLRTLDPADHPVIVMGDRATLQA